MKIETKIRNGMTLLLCTLLLGGCSSTEVIKANSTPTQTATVQLPDHLYMDIGILPLDPGIPATEKAIAKQLIVPDVRRAESQFIAFHLKDTLEATGNWGAVRVTPKVSEAVDLTLSGKISLSDGELLEIQFSAIDSQGRVWLDKTYRDQASKFNYDEAQEDPFQDLYNDFANDLLRYREKLSLAQITDIRRVASLRYARNLSPDAFGQYLTTSKGGYTTVLQLPADTDRMLQRVDKIKDREHLFVDTLDEYYRKFYRDMKGSYDEWRFATYEESINLRRMKKQANTRLISGAALIAAGIYAGSETGTYAGSVGAAGVVAGGVGVIKRGFDRRREAEIHAESLRELSQSLGAEITPYILNIEGQTIELTGTADAQYAQWRVILKEIYTTETGTP
ncbi:MAG: hypothetical protein JKY88_11145 [Pseudomonadales bacterium]|nr:hypothetical protein [Pseudomonadales bacterium]